MTEWVATAEKLNGKACLAHSSNRADLQIFGQNGSLIQTAEDSYQAVVINHKVFNRLAPSFGISFPALKGEERFLKFSGAEFKDVYKALKVPRAQATQIILAKHFSEPHKTYSEAV